MPESCSELGELSISLCHNPTDQKLTVKLNCARALQPVTKDGKLSKYFLCNVKFEHKMATDRLLLGVEETVDVKQAQKNKENNENNRFTKQCFFLRVPCLQQQEVATDLKIHKT